MGLMGLVGEHVCAGAKKKKAEGGVLLRFSPYLASYAWRYPLVGVMPAGYEVPVIKGML